MFHKITGILVTPAVAVMVMVAVTGCNFRGKAAVDPKARLQEYISRSFEVKSTQDRETLMGYLTGDAKRRLGAWSDDQFREAFMESKRQFLKLVFQEIKTTSPQEIQITYELSYLDQGKGHDAKVTNKKLCQMVLDEKTGKWMVSDVHNIKELVEYRNELSLP
jgi:hypothetical protein